ncbi:5251_t:CDS:2, partial [Racocetra fulgida]
MYNGTLPAYLQVGQEVCQRCYNGLMQSSVAMKEHAKATSNIQQLDANTLDPEANTLDPEREVTKKLPAFQTFEEFRAYMESENKNLSIFFEELVLSVNLSQKKEESHPKILSQLLFVCYLLCSLRNKFIINVKSDLALYLDSTGTSNSTINALAELGITSTAQTVWHANSLKADLEYRFMTLLGVTFNERWNNKSFAVIRNVDTMQKYFNF